MKFSYLDLEPGQFYHGQFTADMPRIIDEIKSATGVTYEEMGEILVVSRESLRAYRARKWQPKFSIGNALLHFHEWALDNGEVTFTNVKRDTQKPG